MEFGDESASLDQRWDAGCDGDGFCFRESVSSDCHKACDRSGRGNPLKVFGVGLFGPSSARTLACDAERASEAARRRPSLEFSTISTAGRPLIVESWQVHIE
jgi:hypothetical protein